MIADLEAQLKELESRLDEYELRASKAREANKELQEELMVFKKAVVEQHKKGFYKVVKQVEFFAEDLDLGLFDSFKEVKDGELPDKEEIAIAEEDAGE